MPDNLDDYIQNLDQFAELLPDADGTVTLLCASCGGKLKIDDGKVFAMPARDGSPCCSSECRTAINAVL